MNYILGLLPVCLVLCLAACNDTTTTTTTNPIQTAAIDLMQKYEDFSESYTADGSKGAFVSMRDDGFAHVFLYEAAVDPKVVRLDDRLKLVPAEGKELSSALSDDGNWVVFSRLKDGISQLMVSHFTGTSSAAIALETGHSIFQIIFANGSSNYAAYVDRSATQKILKVVKITGDAAAVTLQEVGSFPDEEKPSFALVGGKLKLVSLSTLQTLEQTVNVRSYDLAGGTWTLDSDGTLKQRLEVTQRPTLLNAAGYFTTKSLAAQKIKNKQGTSATVGTATNETVAVVDGVNQNDLFQSGIAYDWTAAIYQPTEVLTVEAMSGSLDGQYMLISGYDTYSCKAIDIQVPTQKLIRVSDMKTLTWVVARVSGGVPWTDIITSPCDVNDNVIEGGAREFDLTLSRAGFVGNSANDFTFSLESFARGDRELRLAKFTVDWDAGKVSNVTITDVSANARP